MSASATQGGHKQHIWWYEFCPRH